MNHRTYALTAAALASITLAVAEVSAARKRGEDLAPWYVVSTMDEVEVAAVETATLRVKLLVPQG